MSACVSVRCGKCWVIGGHFPYCSNCTEIERRRIRVNLEKPATGVDWEESEYGAEYKYTGPPRTTNGTMANLTYRQRMKLGMTRS